MEPVRPSRATLVDLLDRILDKGLVIHADIIVSVAGIPLIGVNLRAAVASTETMLAYGVMQPWDERTRSWDREQRQRERLLLEEGEPILLEMPGSHYYKKGIYSAWRWGQYYLTPQRLVLHHSVFNEVLLQAPLEEIKGIGLQNGGDPDPGHKRELWLTLGDGKTARIRARHLGRLKEALVERLAARGLSWEESLPLQDPTKERPAFLAESEDIAYESKMWHLMASSPPPLGLNRAAWSPGRLYLTSARLCWWYGFEQRVAFEVPIEKIAAATRDMRKIGSTHRERDVLDVVYEDDGLRQLTSFSGGSVEAWEEILNKVVIAQGTKAKLSQMESCPECGEESQARVLLEAGCLGCGWTSPRLRKPLVPVRLPSKPANFTFD